MEKNILPVLDTDALQKKANDSAQRGAEEAIKDFYTGYDSPYKKAIKENLQNKGLDNTITIPDILGILNESISKEIDLIANNAVSKSFIPLIKKFLTRADAEISLSDILKEFIQCSRFEYDEDSNIEDYELTITKDEGSFVRMEIENRNVKYELNFFIKTNKDETPKIYEIYVLPTMTDKSYKSSLYSSSVSKTMKLSLDGVTLELPFTPKVLEDKFMTYIATLVIANTKITFDVDGFHDDMFPNRDICHCEE